MNSPLALRFREKILEGLREDGFEYDFTTLGVSSLRRSQKARSARARIVAKSEGIYVGQCLGPAVENLARDLGFSLKYQSFPTEGLLQAGSKVALLSGDEDAILIFERHILNLLSYLGGIAYKTHQAVTIVRSVKLRNPPRITSTRKTLPGYRDLAVGAVIAGGGFPHRVSLSGGVLLKENHIARAGSIQRAVSGVRAVAPHGLKIEVEVRNLKELRAALEAEVEYVLLDNFSPKQVQDALKVCSKAVGVEVSGGVNLQNLKPYVQEGVNVISMGGLTHSVTAVDFSLLMEGT